MTNHVPNVNQSQETLALLPRITLLKGKQSRFVYMNFEEHPRGNLMLQSLCRLGFVPELVIIERSPTAQKGTSEQTAVLSLWQDNETPFSTPALAAKYGFAEVVVSDHNSEETAEALSRNAPDLIILGDTRILKQKIIEIPRTGTINVHPGWLPDVRGNNPYIWAIENGLPQGVSAHFVDAGVDTGPIISRRLISISATRSYPELIGRINQECANLIVDTMYSLRNGTVSLTTQPLGCRAYREAGRDVKERALSFFHKNAT